VSVRNEMEDGNEGNEDEIEPVIPCIRLLDIFLGFNTAPTFSV